MSSLCASLLPLTVSRMKPHCPSALLPSQELRLQSDEYREEKEAELEVLTEEVIKLDHDRKELQERVDSLTLSFRHRESIHAMTEKRLQNETMRLVKEREVLHPLSVKVPRRPHRSTCCERISVTPYKAMRCSPKRAVRRWTDIAQRSMRRTSNSRSMK
jgi:hypothetical protein